MSDNVSQLSDRKKPVTYEVMIVHHFDGTVQTFVKDLNLSTQRSRDSVAWALRVAADNVEQFEPEATA